MGRTVRDGPRMNCQSQAWGICLPSRARRHSPTLCTTAATHNVFHNPLLSQVCTDHHSIGARRAAEAAVAAEAARAARALAVEAERAKALANKEPGVWIELPSVHPPPHPRVVEKLEDLKRRGFVVEPTKPPTKNRRNRRTSFGGISTSASSGGDSRYKL